MKRLPENELFKRLPSASLNFTIWNNRWMNEWMHSWKGPKIRHIFENFLTTITRSTKETARRKNFLARKMVRRLKLFFIRLKTVPRNKTEHKIPSGIGCPFFVQYTFKVGSFTGCSLHSSRALSPSIIPSTFWKFTTQTIGSVWHCRRWFVSFLMRQESSSTDSSMWKKTLFATHSLLPNSAKTNKQRKKQTKNFLAICQGYQKITESKADNNL